MHHVKQRLYRDTLTLRGTWHDAKYKPQREKLSFDDKTKISQLRHSR